MVTCTVDDDETFTFTFNEVDDTRSFPGNPLDLDLEGVLAPGTQNTCTVSGLTEGTCSQCDTRSDTDEVQGGCSNLLYTELRSRSR